MNMDTIGRIGKGSVSHLIINGLTVCGRDATSAVTWQVESGKWVPSCFRCHKKQ